MTTTLACPKCGSPELWDNRATKKNPKAPDWKCKDKSCDGVIWPPKGAAAAVAAPPAPAPTNGRAAYSSGPPIAGLDDGSAPLPTEKLDAIFRVYDVCFQHAFSLAERTMKQDASHEGISAMAATCFIAARDRGIGG